MEIPFFAKVNDFVYKLWAQCKQQKYIETPILKRKIHKESVVEQQRILGIIEQLLTQCAYIETGQGPDFILLFVGRKERT